MKLKLLLTTCILAIYATNSYSQIKLQNPSFEGEPQDATTPIGWHPCAPNTTPDIMPGNEDKDVWGVYNEPSDGDTYVGLITRPDNTFESIGQRLSEPLLGGECYEFSVDVSRAKTYLNYNKPIKLRVWGGTSKCDRTLLIGKTDFIEDEEWETIDFKIAPQEGKPINYLIFEAFYSDKFNTRKGNILIDNISVIKKCKRA